MFDFCLKNVGFTLFHASPTWCVCIFINQNAIMAQNLNIFALPHGFFFASLSMKSHGFEGSADGSMALGVIKHETRRPRAFSVRPALGAL